MGNKSEERSRMSGISLNACKDSTVLLRPEGWRFDAIAVLDDRDFERARALIPDLGPHEDYEDWLDSRYGATIGLCASGLDARMIAVDLSSFVAWRRFTGLMPSQKALDAFAGLVGILRDGLQADARLATIASVSEVEFFAYFALVEAFQAAGDYGTWLAQREKTVRAALASGSLVVRMPAPLAEFLEWGRCLGAGSSATLLDRFASLALEALVCEGAR
jgi:hypothetical protein